MCYLRLPQLCNVFCSVSISYFPQPPTFLSNFWRDQWGIESGWENYASARAYKIVGFSLAPLFSASILSLSQLLLSSYLLTPYWALWARAPMWFGDLLFVLVQVFLIASLFYFQLTKPSKFWLSRSLKIRIL